MQLDLQKEGLLQHMAEQQVHAHSDSSWAAATQSQRLEGNPPHLRSCLVRTCSSSFPKPWVSQTSCYSAEGFQATWNLEHRFGLPLMSPMCTYLKSTCISISTYTLQSIPISISTSIATCTSSVSVFLDSISYGDPHSQPLARRVQTCLRSWQPDGKTTNAYTCVFYR